MADRNQKSDGDQKRSRDNANETGRGGDKQDQNNRDDGADRQAQPGRRKSDGAMQEQEPKRDSDQADGTDGETEAGDHSRRDQN